MALQLLDSLGIDQPHCLQGQAEDGVVGKGINVERCERANHCIVAVTGVEIGVSASDAKCSGIGEEARSVVEAINLARKHHVLVCHDCFAQHIVDFWVFLAYEVDIHRNGGRLALRQHHQCLRKFISRAAMWQGYHGDGVVVGHDALRVLQVAVDVKLIDVGNACGSKKRHTQWNIGEATGKADCDNRHNQHFQYVAS